MSTLSCVAVLKTPETTAATFRECWYALACRKPFLGFHFSPRSSEHEHYPHRSANLVIFEIDPGYPPEPFTNPDLLEFFFTSITPIEILGLLLKSDGYQQLKRSALNLTEAFAAKTKTASKKPNKSKGRYFAIYAELPSPAEAEKVRKILVWRPFERIGYEPLFVLSADPDSNPACVRILVTSLNRRKIRALAEEFSIPRITHNFQELHCNQKLTPTAANVR